MNHPVRVLPWVTAATLFTLLLAPTTANAQVWAPFEGTYKGTITILGEDPSNPGFTEAIAEATSTDASYQFSSYDAHFFVNNATQRATGENFFVSDNGNALYGTFWQQNVVSSDPFSILSTFTGIQTFVGGGGAWENTFGAARIEGSFLQTSDTTADFTLRFKEGTLAVPEPASMSLIAGLGMTALAARRRRAKKSN